MRPYDCIVYLILLCRLELQFLSKKDILSVFPKTTSMQN